MNKPVEIPDPNAIRTEEDALDQSIALNKIVLNLLQQQKDSNKRMFIALILSIVVNLFIVGGFLYYESQWEYTTTTTTTATTVNQDTEGEGNNVYQAGENAVYNQGPTETEGVD